MTTDVTSIIGVVCAVLCLAVVVWSFWPVPRSSSTEQHPSVPELEPVTSLDGILPVLRNVHGADDGFTEIVVNSAVCEGVGVFAAKPSILPDGMQFVQYVMKSDLPNLGNPTGQDVMKLCMENLAKGLKVNVMQQGEAKMIALEGPGRLSAAAIALPDLYQRCVEWMGGAEFVAGAPNLDALMICPADSPFRERMESMVRKADNYGAIDFDPMLFTISSNGITRLP